MRRKKRGRVAFRFYVLVVVAVVGLGYGANALIQTFVTKTAVVTTQNMDNKYQADAVIMRDERVTDDEGLVRVTYYAEEGSVVYNGSKIAEVYTAGYSQSDMNQLLTVRSQIKGYHKQLISASYSEPELDLYNSRILERAHELELMVQGKAKGNLINLNRQLQLSLDERQNYMRTAHASDQTLSSYYDSETSILKKIDSWTRRCFAESDCIVSFYTDGYESMLKAANFETITAQEVRSVVAGEAPVLSTAQKGRTAIYREVTPTGWYLLLLSHDTKWNPQDGETYRVRLMGFDDHIVDGVVQSSSRTGNELLVRMRVAGDVRPVLNVRSLRAEVGDKSVSGLWVPVGALYRQGEEWGVVINDGGQFFVPVTIIDRDSVNEYAIIEPVVPGMLKEGQKVRLFS